MTENRERIGGGGPYLRRDVVDGIKAEARRRGIAYARVMDLLWDYAARPQSRFKLYGIKNDTSKQ